MRIEETKWLIVVLNFSLCRVQEHLMPNGRSFKTIMMKLFIELFIHQSIDYFSRKVILILPLIVNYYPDG